LKPTEVAIQIAVTDVVMLAVLKRPWKDKDRKQSNVTTRDYHVPNAP